MRTTVDLDDDVAAAIDALRRARGVGLSQAVNELIRRGLVQAPAHRPFRQRAVGLGMNVDVTNVAEALEITEAPPPR